MKRYLLYFLLLVPLVVWAAVTTIISGGNWNDSGIWSGGNIAEDISEDASMNDNIGEIAIRSGDEYTISDFDMNNGNTLTIDNGGLLTIGSLAQNFNLSTGNVTTINVSGDLEIWGILDASNTFVLNVTSTGTVIVHGNLNVLNNAVINVQGTITVVDLNGGNNTDVNVDGTFIISGNIDVGVNSDLTGCGTVNLTGSCTGPASFCNSVPLGGGMATADAGSPAVLCFNASHQLAATATNGTILWTTSGDGTFDDATLEDPAYNFGVADILAGSATLTLTVTGSCNTPSDDIVLTVDPESIVDAGFPVALCFNAPYQLRATATNGIILWTTSGDGTFDDVTLEDPIYTFGVTDIGSSMVTLTMSITGNCNSPSDNVVLTRDPGATEINDGIDNDCDGLIDEGFDTDGDGYSAGQGDCNDSNAAINPSATELDDGIDNNCNGMVDEGFDADGDGYSIGQGDCDDTDAALNPDTVWFADEDGDGFGNPNNILKVCIQPAGYVTNSTDCSPNDADVYPGAPTLPDGKDNDCDGEVDKVAQSITIEPIADQVDANGSVTIVANSTSGLNLTFSIAGPADLFNDVLILTGAGLVTVTASQSGNSKYLAADPVTVTFCVKPLPAISQITEGSTVLTLESNYDIGNQWYSDGTMIDGATEQQYIIDKSGSYSVLVSIDGCIGDSEGFDAVLTAIEFQGEISTTLYPNPAQNYLNIELSSDNNNGISEIFIISSNGSTIMTKSAGSRMQRNKLEIDVSDLKTGTYFLIIKTGDELIRKRFGKQ